MVEYKPLIRLVGMVVLYPKYLRRWSGSESGHGSSDGIDFSRDDGSFAVTLAINAMISKKTKSSRGEEADAGGGGGSNATPDVARTAQESIGENEIHETGASSHGGSNEMDYRSLETNSRGMRDYHQPVVDLGHSSDELIPNRHRAALLDMLAGHPAYSSDETILASMLIATILENDAIDDLALEVFSVLPSPTINNEGDSPFETSIATYLSKDFPVIDSNSHFSSTSSAVECVSTLGFMLLERLIFHTWTEAGQCIDIVPFDHFYKSSTFIQALGRSLTCFASQAQSHLHDASSIREIFSACIRRRYSSSKDVNGCPPSTNNDDPEKMVCSIQSYYPSNFIDDASVLAGEMVYGAQNESATGDLFLFNHDNELAMCAVQATLHLRSLLTCIQEFYQRFTSNTNSRWSSRRESLSFRTTEEADGVMMSIGGIEKTPLPEVGTDIDLRGRKFFHCSLPRKARGIQEVIIDANGMKIRVTENADLMLVVDPLEIYVTKAKRDNPNRCTVLAVVPLRTIIASATEVSFSMSLISFHFEMTHP